MALIYGILCSSGNMMYEEDGKTPCWFATRKELREYWCGGLDRVVILDTETLNIVVEDAL